MNWIKLEPGCQMPEIDEFVLWRTEEGNYFIAEIDKDDTGWWNQDGPGGKCTHWKRITGPDEKPDQDQDILWGEVSIQLNDLNLEGEGRRKEVIDWLKNKYTLMRK